MVEILPNIAKEFEQSTDSRTLTLYLRSGMKWSDGTQFNAADLLFWHEAILSNKSLTPEVPRFWKSGGKAMKLDPINDTTISFKTEEPAPWLIYVLSNRGGTGTQRFGGPFQPAHYLKQFHSDYVDIEDLEALARAEGYETWVELFKAKQRGDKAYAEDLPVLGPWVAHSVDDIATTSVRNPFYFKIDTAGNQLPYIDTIVEDIADDHEVALQGVIAGSVHVGSSGSGSVGDWDAFSILAENSDSGKYRISIASPASDKCATEVALFLNHTVSDPVLSRLFRDPVFKRALSHAIDRDEINEVVYQGWSEPRGSSIHAQEEYGATPCKGDYAHFDPGLAKQLLDQVNLQSDAEGNRLRDDSSHLKLSVSIDNRIDRALESFEVLSGQLQEIGIKAELKSSDDDMWRDFRSNDAEISIWRLAPSSYGSTMEQAQWWSYGYLWGKGWYDWYHGIEDSKWFEEPPANVKDFMDTWRLIPTISDKAERDELGLGAIDNLRQSLWYIGLLAPVPEVRYVSCKVSKIDLDGIPRLYYAYSAAFQWEFDKSRTCPDASS